MCCAKSSGGPGHLTKLQMLQKIKEKYAHAASIIFNYAQIKTNKTLTKNYIDPRTKSNQFTAIAC